MFKKLNNATAKPAVWSQYTADVLWTDHHIAQQMLTYHMMRQLQIKISQNSNNGRNVLFITSIHC